MNDKRRGVLIDTLCLSAIWLWLAVYSAPYFLDALAGNAREIQTYNLDSVVMLKGVEEALAAPWFHLSFNDYGHFYFNLSMAVASIYALFRPLTEHALFLILRLMALLGGYLSIVAVYAFAKRYLGRLEAVFAALLMTFSPRFIEFSNEVKPDSWQLFVLLLSVYFLARAFEGAGEARVTLRLPARFGFVLAASAAAGAAFGTKYQGMLLIPLLALAAAMVPLQAIADRFYPRIIRVLAVFALPLAAVLAVTARTQYPLHLLQYLGMNDIAGQRSGLLYWTIQAGRLGCVLASVLCLAFAAFYVLAFDFTRLRAPLKRVLILAATAMAFLGAFALTSPWLVYHLQFVGQIYLRSAIAGGGQHVGLRWLAILFGYFGNDPLFVSYATGGLSLVGVGILLVALARRDLRMRHLPWLFVLAFAAIFLGLLVAKINFMTTLYLLPLVPALVLLAAFALHEIGRVLPRWLEGRRAVLATAVLAGLFLLAQIGDGGAQLLQYPLLVKELSPQNRQLGDWLVRCVPADTSLLAAAYSYAPPQIRNVVVSMGGDYVYYKIANPDVVTIDRQEAANTIRDEEKTANAPGHVPSGPGRYYQMILKSGAWRPGPVFGPFQVYVKNAGSVLKPGC
jgi:4-amino-4-deoxy-L-arabinose transferase-like glycosyltransferase